MQGHTKRNIQRKSIQNETIFRRISKLRSHFQTELCDVYLSAICVYLSLFSFLHLCRLCRSILCLFLLPFHKCSFTFTYIFLPFLHSFPPFICLPISARLSLPTPGLRSLLSVFSLQLAFRFDENPLRLRE